MTDVRVGSSGCRLQMPELKNGVACPLGSIILEVLLGRSRMMELIFDCEVLDANTSRSLTLLNQLVSAEDLQLAAQRTALKLAAYPRTSFVATKHIQNERFVAALESVREPSSRAHVEAFLRKTGKAHFEKILGRP